MHNLFASLAVESIKMHFQGQGPTTYSTQELDKIPHEAIGYVDVSASLSIIRVRRPHSRKSHVCGEQPDQGCVLYLECGSEALMVITRVCLL